jgi:hypothetical protein
MQPKRCVTFPPATNRAERLDGARFTAAFRDAPQRRRLPPGRRTPGPDGHAAAESLDGRLLRVPVLQAQDIRWRVCNLLLHLR